MDCLNHRNALEAGTAGRWAATGDEEETSMNMGHLHSLVHITLMAAVLSPGAEAERGQGIEDVRKVPVRAAYGFTTIDVPGALTTSAQGVNSAGEIVGSYVDGSGGHAFLLSSKGAFTTIDFPGALRTFGSDISTSGEIAGSYFVQQDGNRTVHGFLLEKTGHFATIEFPGAIGTSAEGITPAGEIVGIYTDDDGVDHGYLLATDAT
ncbi:MAG: hypothetical protein PVI28_10605, partial [Gammaproteobacteria bacterium]